MMDLQKLIAAVPDIGDKAVREATIARMAHAAGRQEARDEALDYYGPQNARLAKEKEALATVLQEVVRLELPPGMQVPGAMKRLGHPWPAVADALWPGA